MNLWQFLGVAIRRPDSNPVIDRRDLLDPFNDIFRSGFASFIFHSI